MKKIILGALFSVLAFSTALAEPHGGGGSTGGGPNDQGPFARFHVDSIDTNMTNYSLVESGNVRTGAFERDQSAHMMGFSANSNRILMKASYDHLYESQAVNGDYSINGSGATWDAKLKGTLRFDEEDQNLIIINETEGKAEENGQQGLGFSVSIGKLGSEIGQIHNEAMRAVYEAVHYGIKR